MTDKGFGCWSVVFMLPSAIVWAFRQAAWERSFPRPQKLPTAKDAMAIADELSSERGGSTAAFAYVQRALELEPQNVGAAKFMANYYAGTGKFSEALPYVTLAAHGSHPDSVYRLMLKEALSALGKK